MKLIILFFLICVALLPATPDAVSGAADSTRSIVDAATGPLARGPATGVAVGIVQGTTATFYTYGLMRRGGSPITPDTLFEIASVTKVFTSTLLGQFVVEGRRALSDPMAQYLPGFLFSPGAQKVTLLQLATFTAGLPDYPPGLPRSYTQWGLQSYTLQDLQTYLERWAPPTLPAPYLYSNLSYGLLGHALSTQDESWLELLGSRITAPLQLPDTVLTPSQAQSTRLAQGYSRQGQPVSYFPVTVWLAAGGLKSTVRDLVTFAAANMGIALNGITIPPTLQQGMQQAQRPYFARNPLNSQALAWVVRSPSQPGGRGPLIVKNGGHPGFSSAIVLFPSGSVAVVVLANAGGVPVTEVAIRLIVQIPIR